MKQYTDITVLLDRSGSMSSIRSAMESAFDNFIKEHKAVESTRITLIQFDDQNRQDIVYLNCPVGSVEKLNLVPRGNTPLLDAMCTAIDATGQRLANLRESDRPDQVLMVIITDGQENCSCTYNRKNVMDRVTKQREGFNWQFIYLGANQDVFAEAASFGIPMQFAMNYNHSYGGTLSMANSLTTNTVAYASNTSRGTAAPEFTKEQRKEAEKV